MRTREEKEEITANLSNEELVKYVKQYARKGGYFERTPEDNEIAELVDNELMKRLGETN